MELGKKYERGHVVRSRMCVQNVRHTDKGDLRTRKERCEPYWLIITLSGSLRAHAPIVPSRKTCRLKHTFCISLCSPTPRFRDFINVMVIRNQEKELPLLRHCRPLVPIRHIRRVREIVMIYGRGVVGVVGAVSSASGADVGTMNLRPVRDHILVDHATEKRVAT